MSYEKIDSYLKRLRFFGKYPQPIRKQLLDESEIHVFEAGDTIFRQGESSPYFYVILRGSTKAILSKKDYGNIPIVVSTFYDGKEFGEITQYEVSENLTPDMVKQLNKQKYTCEAMEQSFILALEKERTDRVINKGL